MSELFDNNSFEQWLADGAKDADARGLEAARKALDGYVAPALESGVEEALAEFIARRERELPDKQTERRGHVECSVSTPSASRRAAIAASTFRRTSSAVRSL